MTRSWTEADMTRARALFETTDWPVARIARETKVSCSILRRRAVVGGWTRPDGPPEAAALARPIRARHTRRPGRRRGVDERLIALLRRQIRAAERGFRRSEDLPTREREARLAASLTRSFLALEARRIALPTPPAPQEEQGTPDAALFARTPDELRAEFAARLAALFGGGGRPPAAELAAGDRGLADPAMDHARP